MKIEIEDFFNLEDIDLIVKYLYVKAKIENNNYDFYKKLYEKSIMRGFGGVNDGKTNISEFINSFDILIESIQKNSFDEKLPILISKNNMILNGRHRLAICLYLNIKPKFEKKDDMGHKRFELDLNYYDSVFSNFEKETIILDYLNNFKDENYFLTFLWGDSEEKWDTIENIFREKGCKISYTKNFNFKDENYFENVLEGIYTHENGFKQNGNIFIKTEKLKKNMRFKLLFFKYEGEKTYRFVRKDLPICREIEQIKQGIRRNLYSKPKNTTYSYLHTSDDYEHTKYLCNFMFNKNIKYLKKISKNNKYINRTNKFLTEYEIFLKKNKVDKNDFCLESGIILQIFGIRKAGDLDFICLKYLRNNLNFFTENIDLHKENRFYKISKLTDDTIIKNRENYFIYKGFKFISPELLIKNTINLTKKKNLDMIELKKLISKEKIYHTNLSYKIKVFFLLKYYRIRRVVVLLLTLILTKEQKFKIKKFLNKNFKQNYNLDADEVIKINWKKRE